jgi:hypothetical protein
VETQIRIARYADVLTRNIAQKNGTRGYTGAHNPNPYSLCGKRGPLILIGIDEAAMIIGDVDGLCVRSSCEGQENDHKELPEAPLDFNPGWRPNRRFT